MYERSNPRKAEPVAAPPGLHPGQSETTAPLAFPVMLWRHKGTMAASVLTCIAAALAFSILAAPSYTATTQIIIDPTDLRVVDNSLRSPNTFSDSQIAQVEDEVRVLSSSTVLRRVVETEHLDGDDEFNGSGRSFVGDLERTLKTALGRADPAADPTMRTITALRKLAKALAARREERTFVVDVSVKTRDPEKSARLADAVVAAFLAVSAQTRNAAARRITESLTGRLSELRHNVEAAEKRVVDFKKQHNIVAAVGQNVTEQQLANVSTRLGEIRNQVAEAQSRYAQVLQAERSGDTGAVPEALQSTTVTALRGQLAEVMRRQGDLAATLGQRHPAMSEMRAQERTLRTLLHEELARIAAVTKSNLDRARADQQATEASFKALEANVTNKSDLSVRLGELERDAQAGRTVFEAFLTRPREVGGQEQINTANVSVISPAQVPETKTWPPRSLYVLLGGTILGVALGVGLALASELVKRNRSTPVRLARPDALRS